MEALLEYKDIFTRRTYIKKIIDGIQEENYKKIKENVDLLYFSFKINSASQEVKNIEFNYLIYKIIIIFKELDLEYSNQNTIKFIIFDLHENLINKGSSKYLKGFLCELANYIKLFKEDNSCNILSYVINEINNNYMKSLSLKYLGKKYFINSAYLGQLFQRKYNKTFKDYLNEIRIEKSIELLRDTDKKVYEISEIVGYSNTDYFIKKFVEIKGTTPFQYKTKHYSV